MTQKELLYVEDAISHEGNIIKICNDMINRLDNEELVSFIEEQVNIHTDIKNRLLDLMEVKVNE